VRQLAGDGLLVGILAWTQPSLTRRRYPPALTAAEQRLQFYSRQFAITEVDASFCRPLSPRTAAPSVRLWAGRAGGVGAEDQTAPRGRRPVHVLMDDCADGACVRPAWSLAVLLADGVVERG